MISGIASNGAVVANGVQSAQLVKEVMLRLQRNIAGVNDKQQFDFIVAGFRFSIRVISPFASWSSANSQSLHVFDELTDVMQGRTPETGFWLHIASRLSSVTVPLQIVDANNRHIFTPLTVNHVFTTEDFNLIGVKKALSRKISPALDYFSAGQQLFEKSASSTAKAIEAQVRIHYSVNYKDTSYAVTTLIANILDCTFSDDYRKRQQVLYYAVPSIWTAVHVLQTARSIQFAPVDTIKTILSLSRRGSDSGLLLGRGEADLQETNEYKR